MIPIRAIKTNRWLMARLAGLISVCVVFLRLHLWRYDLSVPIVYWGDALYETVLVKALTEGALNYHIPRLAAPFGMDAVDFPIGGKAGVRQLKYHRALGNMGLQLVD